MGKMKAIRTDVLVDGILLLNKPQGITSNQALQQVKKLFNARKAGHTGSLDPLATGMLPICFGEATKVCQYLLDADKCYETTGVLGIKTDSADATGKIISQVDNFLITNTQLIAILEQFKGLIKQVPSMFSALKHHGKPLYHYARAGKVIEREAREINIKKLELTHFDGHEFSLTVLCSKGTYIRNLVEDIGDSLAVGAHVSRLHRLYTLGFSEYPMHTLEDLALMSPEQRLNCLLPMDIALTHFNSLSLSSEDILALRQGKVLTGLVPVKKEESLRLYDAAKRFIGLGEVCVSGDVKAKRLLAF